ncbi:Hypothetical Protein FCC1311_048512 [Hondaea fermentalgiana]|uniref:Uncharacterized protein n=1 Tax=Hondaea fermentalgiana TaxID=2315210 RepID=A0A2R5GCC3_9STRA|nr:Hypothetical Protein FCC1311_048512 [Hondaea fermentalgiana]|eukprot:GBG28630.1 Hypothetical Protein FCC1311_048512 [Hondaea fermentalgiana]
MKRARQETHLLDGDEDSSGVDELEAPRDLLRQHALRKKPRRERYPSAWACAMQQIPVLFFALDSLGRLQQLRRFDGGTLEASRATGLAYYLLHSAAATGRPCDFAFADRRVCAITYG